MKVILEVYVEVKDDALTHDAGVVGIGEILVERLTKSITDLPWVVDAIVLPEPPSQELT